MNSLSKPDGKSKRNKLIYATLIPLLSALLVVSQVSLSFLPNFEIISLLIIIYTISLGAKVLPIIYIFAFSEMLIYGFSMWAWTYLYVWTVLWLVVMLLRRFELPFYIWAVISGMYGLVFGLLCSFVYALTGGLFYGLSWWISGLKFDLVHCAGNFIICITMFYPLNKVFSLLSNRMLDKKEACTEPKSS